MPPAYYNEGKRPLNRHVYLNYIVSSPLCDCGAVETSRHYVFLLHMV